MHICLLGDSILDNKAYTAGKPSVVEHLNRIVPQTAQATLLAVDGSYSNEVAKQLAALPEDATHLVVSSGGNDALGYEYLLAEPVNTVSEALSAFAEPLHEFEHDYRRLIKAIHDSGVPARCCTIYNGCMDEPVQPVIRVALGLFNDIIFRTAHEHSLPVIELRRVCTETSDYANPIEPSGSGGEKIARAILKAIVTPNAGEPEP